MSLRVFSNRIEAMYAIYNDKFIDLKNLWQASLVDNIPIHLVKCEIEPPKHDLRGSVYVKLIHFKVDQEVRSIQENMGKVIIWSDIDVVFLRNISKHVSRFLGSADVCFVREQHGSDRLNGGFIVIRCNDRTLDLFTKVSNTDLSRWEFHDQDALRHFKGMFPNLIVHYFPIDLFCCHHVGCGSRLVMYHATNPPNKIHALVGKLKAEGQWNRVRNKLRTTSEGRVTLRHLDPDYKVSRDVKMM